MMSWVRKLATPLLGITVCLCAFGDIKSPGVSTSIAPGTPTISSGFGTSPSIVNNNGTSSFSINVGTGGVATSGVIGLPQTLHGWAGGCSDVTTPASNLTQQTGSTSTTATVTNYVRTTGLAGAWPASDILECSFWPN